MSVVIEEDRTDLVPLMEIWIILIELDQIKEEVVLMEEVSLFDQTSLIHIMVNSIFT